MIKVLFFAALREQLGCAALPLEYSGQATVAEVKSSLIQRDPSFKPLAEQQLLYAVNQTLCGQDNPVNDGDEVAFFPPVTGG